MAFLLDTHALLWWLAEPERLSHGKVKLVGHFLTLQVL